MEEGRGIETRKVLEWQDILAVGKTIVFLSWACTLRKSQTFGYCFNVFIRGCKLLIETPQPCLLVHTIIIYLLTDAKLEQSISISKGPKEYQKIVRMYSQFFFSTFFHWNIPESCITGPVPGVGFKFIALVLCWQSEFKAGTLYTFCSSKYWMSFCLAEKIKLLHPSRSQCSLHLVASFTDV